jgi:hypothetical protein
MRLALANTVVRMHAWNQVGVTDRMSIIAGRERFGPPEWGRKKMRRLLGVGLLAMGIIGLPWAKTVKEEKVKEETGQGLLAIT